MGPIKPPRLPLGRRRSTILLVVVLALAALGYIELPGSNGPKGGTGDGPTPDPGSSVVAKVIRIVDGDTAVVDLEGHEERLRYIGIDTPESVKPNQPVECYGKEAARRNEQLVAGKRVRLVIGAEPRDHYGRLLAYVHLGELMVNAELVREGYATALTVPPNDRFAAMFRRLEREAQEAGRGLWGSC
jgi:micrococcal nuclease